jgi:hypothetical protein
LTISQDNAPELVKFYCNKLNNNQDGVAYDITKGFHLGRSAKSDMITVSRVTVSGGLLDKISENPLCSRGFAF